MAEADKNNLKVICTQENLKNGLQVASRVISSSNTLPILSNVLLKTENGLLKISSTNLEIAISTTIRCKVEVEGEVCAPAKILTDLINSLPNQNITLEQKGFDLHITTDHYNTTIKTLPSEDFPIIPQTQNPKFLEFSSYELKQILDKVVFAAAQSETQPEISGVYFSQKSATAKFVATDRYRLSEQKVKLNSANEDREAIIPQKAVAELSRILANQKDGVEIAFSDNQFLATVGETQVVSRLIDGQFPNYEEIIPTTFNTLIVTDRAELASALKTSGIFSRSTNSVKLQYLGDDGKIKISSISQDLGDSEVDLPSEVSGEVLEGEIIFNHRYILEALNVMTEEKVVIQIVNDSTAVILKGQGNESLTCLVMPIKT